MSKADQLKQGDQRLLLFALTVLLAQAPAQADNNSWSNAAGNPGQQNAKRWANSPPGTFLQQSNLKQSGQAAGQLGLSEWQQPNAGTSNQLDQTEWQQNNNNQSGQLAFPQPGSGGGSQLAQPQWLEAPSVNSGQLAQPQWQQSGAGGSGQFAQQQWTQPNSGLSGQLAQPQWSKPNSVYPGQLAQPQVPMPRANAGQLAFPQPGAGHTGQLAFPQRGSGDGNQLAQPQWQPDLSSPQLGQSQWQTPNTSDSAQTGQSTWQQPSAESASGNQSSGPFQDPTGMTRPPLLGEVLKQEQLNSTPEDSISIDQSSSLTGAANDALNAPVGNMAAGALSALGLGGATGGGQLTPEQIQQMAPGVLNFLMNVMPTPGNTINGPPQAGGFGGFPRFGSNRVLRRYPQSSPVPPGFRRVINNAIRRGRVPGMNQMHF